MYRRISAAALSLFCLVAASEAQQPPPPEALDGVDVVALLTTGKEVFGKSAHRSTYQGLDYIFQSEESKALFDKAPEMYAVQFGGLCARMGGMVTGNQSDYVVHAGKIYLFGSDGCHKAFVADPEKYIPPPPMPMPSSAGAGARGRALLDTAAAAHGGGALDGMTTYAERYILKQSRPTGEVDLVMRTLWRFPGDARSERTFPTMNGDVRTLSTTLTATAAWGIGMSGAATALPPAVRPAAQVQLGRRLLPILKARQAADVAVAALDRATIEGIPVERVRLVRGPIDVTLHIVASGRVHSMAYVDRAASGKFGNILVTFGDYRDVNGITIPFAEVVTVDGAPDAALSRRLESVEVNAPLDPALFTPPVELRK